MIQGIRALANLEQEHNQIHQTLAENSLGLLNKVATDSSTITRDSLPPLYAQFYKNGGDFRLYINLNNSITNINLSLTATSAETAGDSDLLDGKPAAYYLANESTTGTLAIGNGGTGQTAKTAAFDALAPATTKGDITVHNGTDNIRKAVGANDTVLTADSAQTSGVKWAATGGLVKLETQTPDAATTVSFDETLVAGTRYRLVWDLAQTNARTHAIRFNSDSGNNYDNEQIKVSNGTVLGNSADGISSIYPTYNNDSVKGGEWIKGEAEFVTDDADATVMLITCKTSYIDNTASDITLNQTAGFYNGASNVTSIQYVTNDVSITGTMILYKYG